MFNLQFVSEQTRSSERNEVVIRGQITLGEFSEAFEASLSYWLPSDYEQHWLEAARRIADGHAESAIITNMYDPSNSAFIVWWPMWRINQTIYVHNQLLFLDRLSSVLSPSDPYMHIGERYVQNEEGEKISEWQIGMEDIQNFILTRTARLA
jgi:hypothetical protein